jgi:transposase InsO family protein
VDGCITKAPCGGEKTGKSPVDRGKRGIKRSTAVDARGIPLGTVTAPANRHDSPLLSETLDAVAEVLGGLPERTGVHLDRGYDSEATRERLEERGLLAEISQKGKPAPLAATKRWVVELVSDYGGQIYDVALIIELKDGKMWRETRYYAEQFEPPEGRARWVEQMAS